jgi:hypothetical protein
MRAPIILVLLFLVGCLSQSLPPQNPIIGIYTQTLNNSASYIAASYVKWIEMAGAQVVPIYSFSDTNDILTLLGKINGVLFTGKTLVIQVEGWISQWTTNGPATLMQSSGSPKLKTRKATLIPSSGHAWATSFFPI